MQWHRSSYKKAVIWMALVSTLILTVGLVVTNPSLLLQAGDIARDEGRCDVAVSMYDKVLQSDNVSPPGKAMSYWGKHVCEERLGDIDSEAESLLGFIVHSLEVQRYVDSLPASEAESNLSAWWLRQFDINSKLITASVRMAELWNIRRDENERRDASDGGNPDGSQESVQPENGGDSSK